MFLFAGIIYSIWIDSNFLKIWGVLVVVYITIFNILLKPKFPFRQAITISSWGQPNDPYAILRTEVDVTQALEYAKELTEQTGVKITLTHVMAMGYAYCLVKVRKTIGKIRCGNFHQAKELGITVLVNIDEGRDLAPATSWDTHKMTIVEYAQFLNTKADKIRKGQDEKHEKSVGPAKIFPTTLLSPILTIGGWFAFACGFSIKALEVTAKTGGHCVITNVGAIKY